MEGVWKSLEMWATETLECTKQNLMILVGAKIKTLLGMWRVKTVPKVLHGNENSVGNCTKGHGHYTLARNLF